MGTPVKTCWKFWQLGRAASAGALAPEPPRATRSKPEHIRKVHPKPFFFTFFPVEPGSTSRPVQRVQAKSKFRTWGLSWLNPNVEKTGNKDFGATVARIKKSGRAGSTQIFGKKQDEPAQPKFRKKK